MHARSTTPHVTLPGRDGIDLSARLDVPAGPVRAHAVFAHCFTCSKDLFAMGRIVDELNRAGIAVLRFDFTGIGGSGGDFEATTFLTDVEDLRIASAWLAEHHQAPQLLVGHSLGGAAALAAASSIESVRAVATIGAPSDPTHATGLFADCETAQDGTVTASIAGRTFPVSGRLLDEIDQAGLAERIGSMHKALLVLHSPIDNVVGIEHAGAIFTAARHPKSFVALDGADHLLGRHRDAVFAARTIATWAERFIVDDAPLAPAPAPTAPVVVAEAGQGKFLNHVVVGDHRFLADEPVDVGGFDAGPTPYDLLAAALGACTSMTMRMYADRKQLPVDHIAVEVRHDKVHHADGDGSDGPTGLIDQFTRTIALEGDLTAEQRASLLSIADRCPVHRTLRTGSRIVTSEAGA